MRTTKSRGTLRIAIVVVVVCGSFAMAAGDGRRAG